LAFQSHLTLYERLTSLLRLHSQLQWNLNALPSSVLDTGLHLTIVSLLPFKNLNRIRDNFIATCSSCTKIFSKSPLIRGSIFRLIRRNEQYKLHASLSDFQAAIESGCHFCTLMWNQMCQNTAVPPKSKLERNPREKLETSHVSLILRKVERGATYSPPLDQLHYVISYENLVFSGCLKEKRNRFWWSQIEFTPHASFSQTLTSSAEHISLAKSWLDGCLLHHPTCRPSKSGFRPRRVLSVGNNNESRVFLYETQLEDVDIHYCTLSHRWGDGTGIPSLTTLTLESFKESIPWDILPKSFQDAIMITRYLGEVYLWIDSLCIIQDSLEDWSQEAAQMASLFECSQCTISASAAKNALDGCFVERNPLKFSHCKLAGTAEKGIFVESDISDHCGGFDQLLESSPLSSRAWVMQERILSVRILDFGKNGIFWSCRCGFASETRPKGWAGIIPSFMKPGIFEPTTQGEEDCEQSQDNDEYGFLAARSQDARENPSQLSQIAMRMALDNTRWGNDNAMQPGIVHSYIWGPIVIDYSRRDMTYRSDKLVALSGIASRIQEITGFRYLAGLWYEMLLHDMAWYITTTPYTKHQPCTRPLPYRAPTWSWTSTNGEIDFLGRYSSHGPQLNITVDEVEITPEQPGDRQRTGGISGAMLKVTGGIRKLGIFQSYQEFKNDGLSTGYWSYQRGKRLFSNTNLVYIGLESLFLGYCYPDIPFVSGTVYYLLQFREALDQSYDSESEEDDFVNEGALLPGEMSDKLLVDCLILIMKENFFERVGLFASSYAQRGGLVSRWFEGWKEQQVVIR
jgi:hypothetical protein